MHFGTNYFSVVATFQWVTLSFNSLKTHRNWMTMTFREPSTSQWGVIVIQSFEISLKKKICTVAVAKACVSAFFKNLLTGRQDKITKKRTTKNTIKMPGRVHLNTKIQDPESQNPTPKSKATSTQRGSMGLKGLKWTYPSLKQNYRNTQRSGLPF